MFISAFAVYNNNYNVSNFIIYHHLFKYINSSELNDRYYTGKVELL